VLLITLHDSPTWLDLPSFPIPRKGTEKGSGFHCLHMCITAVDFHWHHGPSIYYTRDIQNRYSALCGPYTYTCIVVPNMVYVVRDFDHTLSDAFKWVSATELIIKPEERSMIAMFIL